MQSFQRHLFIFTMLVITIGCCQQPPVTTWETKAKHWQAREQLVEDTTEHTTGAAKSDTGIMIGLRKILFVNQHPVWVGETTTKDHWMTSDETIDAMLGDGKNIDCEDISAYWYAKVRTYRLVPDSQLAMRTVKLPSGGYHTVVIVYSGDGGAIYAIDNGVLMRYSARYADIQIEFDLWSIWQ